MAWFFGEQKRRKRRKRKNKKVKRGSKKHVVSGSVAQKDFIRVKKLLAEFDPKRDLPRSVIRSANEKQIENNLYTALSYTFRKKFGTQVGRRTGIVDMAYKKVGIELKVNKLGVKRFIGRLAHQVKNYQKSYKKLVIYVVNVKKSSGEDNGYLKNYILKELLDIRSIRKRDIAVIVKSI